MLGGGLFLQSLTAPPNNECSNLKKDKHIWRSHMPGSTPPSREHRPSLSTSFANSSSMPHCQYTHTCCGPGGSMEFSRAGRTHASVGHSTHRPSVLYSTVVECRDSTLGCRTAPPSPRKLSLGQEEASCSFYLPECLPARMAKEVSYMLEQPSGTPTSYRGQQREKSPHRHPLGP